MLKLPPNQLLKLKPSQVSPPLPPLPSQLPSTLAAWR